MFGYDDLCVVLDALRVGAKSEGGEPFKRRLPGSPLEGYWANDLVDEAYPRRGRPISNGLMANDALFYSEAHLQLLFAMGVYRLKGERFDCMPEYPIYVKGKRCEVDLLIKDRQTNEYTVIEFKYKTANSSAKDPSKHLKVQTGLGQDYEPANHLAHDLARYDVLADLSRTRAMIDDPSIKVTNGFVVFLSNDHAYWDGPDHMPIYGESFDLRDSRTIYPGLLAWKKMVKPNSVGKHRLAPIAIKRYYRLVWHDYFTVARCQNKDINRFRILVIEA